MKSGKSNLKRMDNVGIAVESLDETIAFFAELGLKLEGRAMVEGAWAGRVTGLDPQRVEIAMLVTPDGHSRRLEFRPAGAGAVRLARTVRDREVPGSNPGPPTRF